MAKIAKFLNKQESLAQSKPENRSTYRAVNFFGNIAKASSSFFDSLMNMIYSNSLKLVENIIGNKLYISFEELSPLTSRRTKKIIANLVRKGIIKQVMKTPREYHDEPDLPRYRVVMGAVSPLTDGYGGTSKDGAGGDSDERKALMKAVGEGIERFSLYLYKEKDLLLSSYEKVSKRALNPLSFAGISTARRKLSNKVTIDENSLFRWVEGSSLFNNKKALIPAQLVYIGYKYHSKEPVIQQQLSTGAAVADSLEEALYGGICEAIERDAFMINYLNKLSPPLVDLETIDDKDFQKTLTMFKRYNLELYVFETTTDIAVPSMMAIIIDRSGIGPAVHVGNKTSLNIKEAVIGAAYECLKGRISFRKVPFTAAPQKEKMDKLIADPSQIRTFEDRFLYWASPDSIEKLDFLFQGQKRKISQEESDRYKDASAREKLKTVLNLLKTRNVDVYWLDIAIPQIKEEGVWVTKVVSPQLQPLFLNEGLRHFGGERLFKVPVVLGRRAEPLAEEELNLIPHPFL